MNKTKIIADTGCSLTEDLINEFDLDVMGMKIVLDGKNYTDHEDITREEFYNKIENINDFYTSQPSIGEIQKHYEKIFEEGYEEIIDIHFSSKMSGLINSCRMVKNSMNKENIKIIDTENISIGSYMILKRILELLNSGKTIEEIENVLQKIKDSAFIQFSVPTLKYLVKNGRVGKAEGLAGTLLNIKPILGVDEGQIYPISKIRGMKKVYSTMAKNAVDFLNDKPNNVKIYKTYGLNHNKEQMNMMFDIFMREFKNLGIDNYEVIEDQLPPTIICHSGPEVIGLSVYGEKEEIK
ncbi:MAG: DegV family protein [Thermotogota bacterium]